MHSSESLVIQFIAETRDNLDDAARGLLALESSAAGSDLINSIFRSFHTIKGTSGIFPEFQLITTLTHAAEELMDLVRNDRMQLTSEHVDLFLNALDLVGNWLEAIETTRQLPVDALQVCTPLRERFLSFLNREIQESAVAPASGPETDLEPIRSWLAGLPAEEIDALKVADSGGISAGAALRPRGELLFLRR